MGPFHCTVSLYDLDAEDGVHVADGVAGFLDWDPDADIGVHVADGVAFLD